MKMVPKMAPRLGSFGSCFLKKKENRTVRFDYTGAYGLHVNPRPGTPKATQNPSKKLDGFQDPFFLGTIWKITKTDPRKVSKWMTLFPANVPWAPLWAQLVPHSVLEDEKIAQSGPRVLTELKISPKSDTEGPPKIKKWFQKCIFGGTWPGGLREALTISLCRPGKWTKIEKTENTVKSGKTVI